MVKPKQQNDVYLLVYYYTTKKSILKNVPGRVVPHGHARTDGAAAVTAAATPVSYKLQKAESHTPRIMRLGSR